MYDDLYCQNIYNFFNCNTLLALSTSAAGTKNQGFPSMVGQLMLDTENQFKIKGGDEARALQANLAA